MQCPVCGSVGVSGFFRWENAIVHQQFLMSSRREAQMCKRGDIELAFCNNCGLIWNSLFDPHLLQYSAPYEATQMLSRAFQRYAEDTAKYLIHKYDLRSKQILEIGCGDGAFLGLLCQLGHNRGIGFEPNWRTGSGRDLPEHVTIIPDFYSECYSDYRGDLVCCRHVLEHIHEPVRFLSTICRLTETDCPVFFEVPDVSWSLRKLAFWDIYYEHCLYFNSSSLSYLFALCGFYGLEVWEGFDGQYVCIEGHIGSRKHDDRITHSISKESHALADEINNFSTSYQRMKENIQYEVNALTLSKHKQVVVWGAGAKAVAFLNLLSIQTDQIEFVVDINPHKWEAYIPGTGQKIVSPQFLSEHKPEVILVMNPAYVSEIEELVEKLGISAKLWCPGTEFEQGL